MSRRAERPDDGAAVEGAPADVTVLLTGVGAPGATGVVTGLERAPLSCRVVGVDARSDVHGFGSVDEGYVVPGGTADDYLDGTREVAARENVDVILPLTTGELGPLAESRSAFEERGTSVMVSEPDALAIATDAGRLYGFLSERRFAAAPNFRRITSRDALLDAVERLGYPDRPVRVERPAASRPRGVRVLDPSADRFDSLPNDERRTAAVTLDDLLAALDGANPFPELVVVESLPGPEYGVDVVATGTGVPAVVPHTRERTRAGISLAATVERNDELVAVSRAITVALGLEYNVNLRFRYDDGGVPKLVEVTPRVSDTVAMCVDAEANLPALGVRHALGLPVESPDVAWGTTMRRYCQEAVESA